MSTIIISVFIAMVFILVSIGTVFMLGMKSPTLILTDIILDRINEAESPISVSFSSIDRNFRDGIFINDLKLGMGDDELVSFRKATIHKGLFELIRYPLFRDGVLEIEFSDGKASLDPSLFSGSGNGGKAFDPSQVLSALEPYRINIHIHSTDIEVTGIAKAEKTEATLMLSQEHRAKLDTGIPKLSLSTDALSAEGSGLILNATLDEGISAMLSIDSIRGEAKGIALELDDASFDAEAGFPLGRGLSDYALLMSTSLAKASKDDFSLSIGPMSVECSGDGILARIGTASASYRDSNTEVRGIEIRSDMELSSISAELGSTEIELSEALDVDTSLIQARFDRENSTVTLDLPDLSIDSSEPVYSIKGIELSALSINADLLDNPALSASFKASIHAEDEIIDKTTLSTRLSASFADNEISSFSARLSEIKLPLFDKLIDAEIRKEGESMLLNAGYSDRITVSGHVGDGIRIDADLFRLSLYDFKTIIDRYIPVFSNYISDRTTLNGQLALSLEDEKGEASYSLALSDIRFNDRYFSLASRYNGSINGNVLHTDQMTITTDWVRASYSGDLDFRRLLPEGRFNLSMTDSGTSLLEASLSLISDKEYQFEGRVPYFESSSITGNVNWSESGIIQADARLKAANALYPFDILINLNDRSISIDNADADARVSWADVLDISIRFRDFALSVPSADVRPCVLTGLIDFRFDFANQDLSLVTDGFSIINMRHLPTSPDLSFSFYADNSGARMDSIILSGVQVEPLTGKMAFDLDTLSFSMYMQGKKAEDNEEILLSIIHKDDVFTGILKASSLDMRRFALDGMIADINLTGHAGKWEDFGFSGFMNARSKDMINAPRTFSSSLFIDSGTIELSGIEYNAGSLSASSDDIRLSIENGILSGDFGIRIQNSHIDRDYPISLSAGFEASLVPAANLYWGMIDLYKGSYKDIVLSLKINEINIDNRIVSRDRSAMLSYKDGRIVSSGDLLEGYYDAIRKDMDLRINVLPIGLITVQGQVRPQPRFLVTLKDFEISIVNILLKTPCVVFYDPAPISGEVNIIKNDSTFDMFGKLYGTRAEFDVFWMPGERVILHNPTFYIWNNSITSELTDCTVMDTTTFEKRSARVSLGLDFSPTLSFDSWNLDVYVPDGNEVSIRLPIVSSNLDLWGKVSGHFGIVEADNVLNMFGTMNADDVRFSLGMEPLPDWIKAPISKKTTTDFDLLLRKNARFIYPLGPNPILTAVLDENQRLKVRVDENGISADGSLEIRSGEIFYFQKNFFITEGNITLRTAYDGTFDPSLSLRARLRDFDSSGDKVDIYLVMRDASLTNFNPTFESSPAKDMKEIMNILGQNILPSTLYGNFSFSSVVSLVSASVDILSRLGVILPADTGLQSSIRSSLGLDVFSLHTNILENLIYDTVSLASQTLSTELSPMAKYLDGTTLYMGKYLSPDVYLEGMVHLMADRTNSRKNNTFLAEDLLIDTEFSAEWTNELCTVKVFTKPVNLTLFDVIDNLGFSLTKRIVF
ncbi:MAG: translocation/assembly module TamB domain-containing protein [Candidatus Ornithospirochaeta sp.]|nr:translocation/assembly module TamB domain-containing protein [Candidatus Ornithospirochaeta sp.]